MYLSTIAGFPLSPSAVIHVKKLFTNIRISVGESSRVIFEKEETSAKRIVASISRPFTGNQAPQPSSSRPSTDRGLEIKKSSSELYLYLTTGSKTTSLTHMISFLAFLPPMSRELSPRLILWIPTAESYSFVSLSTSCIWVRRLSTFAKISLAAKPESISIPSSTLDTE